MNGASLIGSALVAALSIAALAIAIAWPVAHRDPRIRSLPPYACVRHPA